MPKYKKMKMKAFVPKYVSKAHLGAAKKAKGKAVKKKLRTTAKVGDSDLIMIVTHKEIMAELHAKYTRLFNLSRKTGHVLLENIARTIFERLNYIMENNEEASSTCFKLSSYYRKMHPHFGDFQMILSSLHKIEDEQGTPRTQLAESELAVVCPQLNAIDNIPFDKIKSATDKYSLRITKRVLEHIRRLESEPHQMDSEEDAARKKVRAELKNMSMHLPTIIRQVIQRHLVPEKVPFHRVRIYGEPFLPSKDMMAPFTRRFQSVHITRSDRMYNLLKMNIPPAQYSNLISKDGTAVDMPITEGNPEPEIPGGQDNASTSKRPDTNSIISTNKKSKSSTLTHTVVLNDLFVGVMTEPFTALTADQVESIKRTLETCIEGIDFNADTYWPSFRGRPFYSEGVLKLQCEDTNAVEWLKETVATLESPIPETVLVVKRQTDIPKLVKSAVLLPNCLEDLKQIRRILKGQNKLYQVEKWSVYSIERQQKDLPSTFLVLGIPADQIPSILARGRRLIYKLGNAYIRFFGRKGKLQDMPPNLETATATDSERQSCSALLY